MKILSARHLTTAFVLLAAVAGHAQADYLNWTYTTTTSVPALSVNALSPSGGGTVSLSGYTSAAGAASIPVIGYTTASSVTTPVTFDPLTSTYTLALKITDNATNNSGTLNFNGSIGGNLSATSSTLTNTLTSASPSLTLDGHIYTVNIPSVTLAPPTSTQQNILASISVSDVTGGGPPPTGPTGGVTGVPEPTTLVLSGVGFSFLGFSGWWKRRRRSEKPTA